MPPPEHAEIIDSVGRELAKMGVSGTLVIVGKTIELHGGGTPVAIAIELILEQWALLPPELKQRKTEEMARRLVAARRAARAGETEHEEQEAAARKKLAIGVGGFFGVLLLIGLVRLALPRLRGAPKEEPKAPVEADGQRRERLARACDAVRDRIEHNANFGPFALEGFVVELWLAQKGGADLRAHPAVTGLVANGKLAPTADDKLAGVIGGTVDVADGLDADTARRWAGWSAVTISFRDGFGRAFFEEENRPRFLGLADRLAQATGATHGALYARCAHLAYHDVGAWFRGPDMAGAAATMVYQLGAFTDAKVLDATALTALRAPGGEIESLAKLGAKMEDLVPKLVGTSGGSVTAGPPPTFQFSLAAPARAAVATRALARKMGVGAPGSD